MKRSRAGRAGAGSRRRGGRQVAVIWVCAWGLCVAGCAAQQKKDQATVKALQISGNHEVSAGEIKKKILTTQTGWWPFPTTPLYDPVAWQADLKRIERLYVSRGYYQAEVVKDQVTPQPPDAVRIAVQVSEGP